jgi:hypothetical protein
VETVLQLFDAGGEELPLGGSLGGPEISGAIGEVDVVVAGDEPIGHGALLVWVGRSLGALGGRVKNFSPALRQAR